MTEINVIIAAYYLYTLGLTEGVQYSVTQDLSTNTHVEKDILHYSVCVPTQSLVLSRAFHIRFLWTLPHRGTVSADFCPN